MGSHFEEIKKSIFRTTAGMIVGYLVNIFKENLLTVPNGMAWLAIIELLPIFAFLGDIDIVQYIPLSTAIGYFFVIFSLGRLFMPEWELGLNLILLIVYVFKKIERLVL